MDKKPLFIAGNKIPSRKRKTREEMLQLKIDRMNNIQKEEFKHIIEERNMQLKKDMEKILKKLDNLEQNGVYE